MWLVYGWFQTRGTRVAGFFPSAVWFVIGGISLLQLALHVVFLPSRQKNKAHEKHEKKPSTV